MTTEKRIRQQIVKYLNSLPDCYARSIHADAYNCGWPDIVACLRGRVLCLEVKRPGYERNLTMLQEVELTLWRKAGAVAAVVTSVEDVEKVLAPPTDGA